LTAGWLLAPRLRVEDGRARVGRAAVSVHLDSVVNPFHILQEGQALCRESIQCRISKGIWMVKW